MKGLILAGGTGSRLRPLTHTTQKQLIPLDNKPVIHHVIDILESAGITDIGVVLGGQFPDQVREYLESAGLPNVDLTYIHQGEPNGLADAVACGETYVGDEPFVVYFGDTIIDQETVSNLVGDFNKDIHDGGVILQEVNEPGRFGIAEFDGGGQLVAMHEKPDQPTTNLAYIGAVVLTKDIFNIIGNLEPSWRGELELTHAIDVLAKEGKLNHNISDGLWKDVGTPADVIETNQIILEQKLRDDNSNQNTSVGETDQGIPDSVEVADTATIQPPVDISEECEILGSAVVGPYVSLGSETKVLDANIESSIIMDRVTVCGSTSLTESIIGNDSYIALPSGEKKYGMVLGADSEFHQK